MLNGLDIREQQEKRKNSGSEVLNALDKRERKDKRKRRRKKEKKKKKEKGKRTNPGSEVLNALDGLDMRERVGAGQGQDARLHVRDCLQHFVHLLGHALHLYIGT